MIRVCSLLLLSLLVAIPLLGRESIDRKCDLKKIKKAKYCGSCEKIDPKLTKEGLCVKCYEKPGLADVCIKSYFVCDDCKAKLTEDKTCCEESTNKKVVVKGRIIYRCTGCGERYDQQQECEGEDCNDMSQLVEKTCTKSGTWPHGGTPPKKK